MKDLITEEYRRLNADLMRTKKGYATSGKRWGFFIAQAIKYFNIKTVLDYGCGKQRLHKAVLDEKLSVPFQWENYDPAVRGMNHISRDNYELVICSDVLEHVEPEFLDQTIQRIFKLSRFFVFLNIPCSRVGKTKLADGRSAHRSVESKDWWLNKISENINTDEFEKLLMNLPNQAKWDLNLWFYRRS